MTGNRKFPYPVGRGRPSRPVPPYGLRRLVGDALLLFWLAITLAVILGAWVKAY